MVYNKKGFPFVSDYKRDIFDKYTVIYWIQESYDLIFVFFRGDAFIRRDKMSFFAKKIAELFAIPNLFVSLHPQTKIIGLWCFSRFFVVLSEDGRKKRVFQNQWKTLFYVCTVQVMFVCIYDEIPIVSVL